MNSMTKNYVHNENYVPVNPSLVCVTFGHVNHAGVCLLCMPVKQLVTANADTERHKLRVRLHLMLWPHVIQQLGPDPKDIWLLDAL